MIKFVHSYLDTHYRLDTITFNGEATICKKIEDDWGNLMYSNSLVDEIELIFSIGDDATITLWICEWANAIHFNVDLSEWWKRKEVFFPMIAAVHAHTIASELISVQPMSGPTGKLHYMDYICGIDPAVSGDSITVMGVIQEGNRVDRNGDLYDIEGMNYEGLCRDERIQLILENQRKHILGVSSRKI